MLISLDTPCNYVKQSYPSRKSIFLSGSVQTNSARSTSPLRP